MKIKNIGVLLFLISALVGCQSTFGPEIGMTEKQWLHRTLIADVAYMEDNVKAYRSGKYYYYFADGILVKVDEGMIPARRIQMEITSDQKLSLSSGPDRYDELRKINGLLKDGILTQEEFETEKQKILNESPN